MRARVAYISSLGTTAILVAAALLMLVVVSAIVAFRGWPGGEAGAQVQPVPLTAPSAAANVALVRDDATVVPAVVRKLTSAAVPVASRSLSTAGLVKVPARAASGIVLVPAGGSPMRGPGPQLNGPNPSPVPPGGPLPDPGSSGGPLPPGGGGVDPGGPVPLPSGVAIPSVSTVNSAIGQLLAQTPPPPAVTALAARLR
jgi:hypothetical protein